MATVTLHSTARSRPHRHVQAGYTDVRVSSSLFEDSFLLNREVGKSNSDGAPQLAPPGTENLKKSKETAMYRLTTAITLFGLGLGAQLTYATPPQDVHFVAVRFSDLDLTRSEGAAVLYQRLQAAAKTVCASLDARDLASQMRFRDCVQTGIGSAVAKIDRPVLTAYYKAHTNGRDATIQIAKNQN
jgi:UrcA family protein